MCVCPRTFIKARVTAGGGIVDVFLEATLAVIFALKLESPSRDRTREWREIRVKVRSWLYKDRRSWSALCIVISLCGTSGSIHLALHPLTRVPRSDMSPDGSFFLSVCSQCLLCCGRGRSRVLLQPLFSRRRAAVPLTCRGRVPVGRQPSSFPL